MGDVVDILTEVHRLDVATWGDTRTALVFRCVAGAGLKDGRAARLNSIALTLNLGLATVHDRMLKLARWRDRETGQEAALVERVPDGYVLSPAGEQMLRSWLETLSYNARCAKHSDFQTLLSWAMYFDDPVVSR